MRTLRVPVGLAHAAAGARVTLDADAARYVSRVHRRQPGAPLVLFDPELAREADGELLEGHQVAIERVRDVPPEQRPAVLLQALVKGEKLDAIVRDASELGCVELRVFGAERSVGDASPARLARWKRVAVQAARQCGRADCLRVEVVASLEDAARELDPRALRVSLEPSAEGSLGSLLRRGPPALIAAVGPEGGFTEGERAALAELHFQAARLGRWVHRSETAAAAILGAWLAAE